MISRIRNVKDFWTGIIYVAVGSLFVFLARDYGMGTSLKMGPAYFPTVLSMLLIIIGIISLVRSFIEGYNASDWGRLDAMVAKGYVHRANDAALTWDQSKRGAAWLRQGMPDFRLVIRDIVAEGDRVALRLEGRGTHHRSLFGEMPTGAEIVTHVQWICLFEDGMLAEDWEASDEHDLRRQVGVLPPDA